MGAGLTRRDWYPHDEFRWPRTLDVKMIEGADLNPVILGPGQHVAALVPNPWVHTLFKGGPEPLNFFRHIVIFQ